MSLFYCFGQQTFEVERLSPEEFVILPWGWTPGDLSTLQDIYECGFNLSGFVQPEDLENVSKAKLKAIVYDRSIEANAHRLSLSDKEIQSRAEKIAKETAGNPDVYAYYLRDEPGADEFPGLKKWKDAWARAVPSALSYINLFPNYAGPAQMDAKDYEAYLEKFISIVDPEYISYDHYNLMQDGSMRYGYFANLGSVRRVSLENNIPFWNIVLSNAHHNYIDPSPASLSLQLYTTLAYGGKGISYFTYFSPDIGNYRLAPIDQFGNKTPVWDMLRNVNLQMHAIGKAYIKLKSVHVFHHPKIAECKSGLEDSWFLSSLEGKRGGEADLVVGEFVDDAENPHIIVVNKSLEESKMIDLSFKAEGRIYQINNYSGEAEPWRGENNWLGPGQGRIFFVEK